MMTLTTFDSTRESLLDMLQSVRRGNIQLPDFQRGWVWDNDHIKSLLASILQSYPIGAVMMLQAGNPDVRFKPRLVEGVTLACPPEPERLILDGQQRLTSLYQALMARCPVLTRDRRGNPIERWYYLAIAKVVDPHADKEEAIIDVPRDRIIRNFRGEAEADYSTSEKECASEVFPLALIFDNAGFMAWQMKYVNLEREQSQERFNRFNSLFLNAVQPYQQYQIPLILLRKETKKEAVCQVFEKVNTGGVSLTVFELLTATYAAEDYNLRDDWVKRKNLLCQQKVLSSIQNDDLLQAITLLATWHRHNEALSNGLGSELRALRANARIS
jgi:hypothetical protein